jgi:hypothetical protein
MSEFERALADGAARSRAAAGREAEERGVAPRVEVWRAHGGWLRTRLRDLWVRRRRLIIGLGLFLLFDLLAAVAAATMGTHF